MWIRLSPLIAATAISTVRSVQASTVTNAFQSETVCNWMDCKQRSTYSSHGPQLTMMLSVTTEPPFVYDANTSNFRDCGQPQIGVRGEPDARPYDVTNWTFMVRALRSRNYRLFFSGQSVSLIGTWMTRI